MTTKYLLMLGIGHILGDFYFQTNEMAQEKDERFAGVFKHSIEYTISMLLVIIPVVNRGLIKWVLLYSTSHFIIDTIKYKLLAAKKIKKLPNCL